MFRIGNFTKRGCPAALAILAALASFGEMAAAEPLPGKGGYWAQPGDPPATTRNAAEHASYLAEIYIRHDARFEELIDRLTVRYLADQGERATYAGLILAGRFTGSAEDYARLKAVEWLGALFWPENASVYDPDRTTNADAILKQWRASEADPRYTPAPGLRCDWRWTEHRSTAALAEKFGEAVEGYLALALSQPAYEAAFNPNEVSFLDGSTKRAFLRNAVELWLLQASNPKGHPGGCMETFTNFDAWLEADQKTRAANEPFSTGAAPE